jgi:hypothetical protein
MTMNPQLTSLHEMFLEQAKELQETFPDPIAQLRIAEANRDICTILSRLKAEEGKFVLKCINSSEELISLVS